MPCPYKALHNIISYQVKYILIDNDTTNREDKNAIQIKYKEEGENNQC